MSILSELPPPVAEALLGQIRAALLQSQRKIIVLDDDPTGTQTVHGVSVLTTWSVEAMLAALRDPNPVTYVMTNSRSLPREQAAALSREIADNLRAAQTEVGRAVDVISRSDSTLRGHFPTEIDALCEGLALKPDGIIIVPFFKEGGRYTIHDIHYVAEGDKLVPASETEYARDPYFGYTKSNLSEWVNEKTGGRVNSNDVESISLDDIRLGGVDQVYKRLITFTDGRYIIVNAADYSDLEVFALALLRAAEQGKRFIARSAASYVRVIGGIEPRPTLGCEELVPNTWRGKPGLVVAGSYIRKSTLQIEAALQLPNIKPVQVSVNKLLSPAVHNDEIQHAIEQVESGLSDGQDVVLYTSRELITGSTQEESLDIGKVVSGAMVTIVASVSVRPAWVIAKGGITSSDTATKALNVLEAQVLGQILPGVPVWKTGAESRFPDMTYVVFPGNVGSEDAIAQAITILRCQ
jgi:uncharacterized protein YgbK (DUF1537 family)